MDLSAYARRHPVSPGPLNQHTPGQRIAGFGNAAATDATTRRVLARHQTKIGHQLARVNEAVEIADFCHNGHRGYKGNPAHRL